MQFFQDTGSQYHIADKCCLYYKKFHSLSS
jgi:hypothetical protein